MQDNRANYQVTTDFNKGAYPGVQMIQNLPF